MRGMRAGMRCAQPREGAGGSGGPATGTSGRRLGRAGGGGARGGAGPERPEPAGWRGAEGAPVGSRAADPQADPGIRPRPVHRFLSDLKAPTGFQLRTPPCPFPSRPSLDSPSQALKAFLSPRVGASRGGWDLSPPRATRASPRTRSWKAGQGADTRRAGRAAPFPATPAEGHLLRGTRKQELPGSTRRSATVPRCWPFRLLSGVRWDPQSCLYEK
jgi:hypothetical protein